VIHARGRRFSVAPLVGIRRTAPAIGIPLDTVTIDVVEVNHEPALVLRIAGRIDSVYTLWNSCTHSKFVVPHS
jgi:hypothetical protein